MKNVRVKQTNPEYKKRYKMNKSKKHWVVKALIFGVVVPGMTFMISDARAQEDADDKTESKLNLGNFTKRDVLQSVSNNTVTPSTFATSFSPLVNSSLSIETVTDADDSNGTGIGHTKNYTNSDFQTQFTLTGDDVGTSYIDNSQYFQQLASSSNYAAMLTPAINTSNTQSSRSNHAGAVAFNNQVDMTHDWTLSMDLDLTSLNHATTGISNAAYIAGDSIGLVFSPSSPKQLGSLAATAVNKYGGGSLGILGNKNTLFFGLDFYNNNGDSKMPSGYSGDPSIVAPSGGLLSATQGNQYLGFRQTDGSGNLLGYQTSSFPSGTTVTAGDLVDSLNGNKGATGNQNNWNPIDSGTSGLHNSPLLTATAVASWTATTKTLSIQMNGKTYTYTNLNLGTNSLSVGALASDGSAYTQKGVTLNSFNLSLGTGTTIVKYVNQNGTALRNQTSFIANTTETVGIQGFDEDGPLSTDTRTVDYTSPSFQGYHLYSATPITVESDAVDSSGSSTPGNTMTLTYEGDQQSATLSAICTNGAAVPVTIPNGDANLTGQTGNALSFTTTDTTLAKAGYTYVVMAPTSPTDPTQKQYATLADALAANPTFDSTTTFNGYDANGDPTFTTDSSPQNFEVKYTAANVNVKYQVMDSSGNITDKTTELKGQDSLTPSQPTIGQTLTSSLTNSVISNPATATSTFQGKNAIPAGNHLTGNVYWNSKGTSVPTNALTTSDVSQITANQEYEGDFIYEYAPDNQEAVVNFVMGDISSGTAYPQPSSGMPASLIQDGTTGGSFTFSPASKVPSGWHIDHIVDPSNTSSTTANISGTFDATNNGTAAASADSSKQTYTAYIVPDDQALNINYTFPSGHDLSSSLQASDKSQTAKSEANFSSVSIPQIPGYTSYYTTASLNSGAQTTATSIPAIQADTSNNWNNATNSATAVDSSPQTVSVGYTADTRKILLNCDAAGSTASSSTTITKGSNGQNYVTDGSYDAVSIPQVDGYTSYVSTDGDKTKQAMTTLPAGSFSSTDITVHVTYVAWQATVNYFVQQQDSSGKNIGALTALPSPLNSQTEGSNFNFADLTGNTSDEQTTGLQGVKVIPAGYHVTSYAWNKKPDGTGDTVTPPPTTNWTWDQLTNTSQGQYAASIIYNYTADIQQANITVSGAPSGSNITNGSNTLDGMNNQPYGGTTGGTQVVTVPKINGYTYKVTDGSGNEVSMNGNTFTITYDATNNGSSTTDRTLQNYTITYTANKALVTVNYQYSSSANVNVEESDSTDTHSYTAPSLSGTKTIDTQTGASYTLNIPTITGYDFTVTDSNGKTYAKNTIPSETSDGTNITYTVSYTPKANTAIIKVQFREATYDNNGKFTYTDNGLNDLGDLSFNGSLGGIKTLGITSSTKDFSIPSGWTLDPMGASVANGIIDSQNQTDGTPDTNADPAQVANPNGPDNLGGGNTAKRLTYLPTETAYTIYLARDIQSVQVKFQMSDSAYSLLTPSGGLPATIYNDGRTGNSFTIDASSFAKNGYIMKITDSSGNDVTSTVTSSGKITGTYDDTSNGNAASVLKNNGDGDNTPQVYTVSYTPCDQEAVLEVSDSSPTSNHGQTLTTSSGLSNAPLTLPNANNNNYNYSDHDLNVAGYYFTVTGPDGKTYSSLNEAMSNNKYFDTTNNSGSTDATPQVFTVNYVKSVQEADLLTDTTDPKGAQNVETADGATGDAIQFKSTDDTLNRPGYSYKVNYTEVDSNGTSTTTTYDSLAKALTAHPNYDSSDNVNSSVDAEPQKFVATYTADAQTVNISYNYSDSDGDDLSGVIPDSDFDTAPTASQKSQTSVTDAQGTPITVPTLTGYTPNVTTVTPEFTVDGNGNLNHPTIEVTYTANKEVASFSYVTGESSGGTVTADTNGDFTSFATNTGAPAGATGVMNGKIFTDQVVQTAGVAPSIPGYDFIGYSVNGGSPVASTDLSNIKYVDGSNSVQLIYQPKQQTVTIEYVYDNNDKSPKNGKIADADLSTGANDVTAVGKTNSTGTEITTIPTVDGYTTGTTKITPDFSINKDGSLKTPVIQVVYTANNQSATIKYQDSNGKDLSSRTNGAPTTATGVTDQTIGLTNPTIPGYTLTSITQNTSTNITDSYSSATFKNGANNIVYTYTPNVIVSQVQYIYQLPEGYRDSNISYADNNGQPVSGMPTQTIQTSTDATGYNLNSNFVSNLTLLGSTTGLPTGFKLAPATQEISTVASQTKPVYYFYVVPVDQNLSINYLDQDNNNLNKYIDATNEQPIMNAQSSGAADFTTSGSISIPGYTYSSFNGDGTVSGTNNTIVSNTGAQTQTANYKYSANAQTIQVNYVYDINNQNSLKGQAVPSDKLLDETPYTTITGVSNGTTITSSSPSGLTGAISSIDVPTVTGYKASFDSYTPSFATVLGQDELVQPTITVVYTAIEDNTATIQYVDENGNDLSSKAVDSSGNSIQVKSAAKGSTNALIDNSGSVTIPGYDLKEIDYTPYNGSTTTVTDPSTVEFSGAGTSGDDNLKFVYTPKAQSIQVNYLYQNGGKAGQNVSAPQTVSGHTDDPSGTVNALGGGDYATTAVNAPNGYTLITTNPQTVQWKVDNKGALTQDAIDFYYQANKTSALINYGFTASPNNQLNGVVPDDTLTGVQTGLTDDNIPVSGPVQIPGYSFTSMTVNGTEVATTTEAAKNQQPVYTPNASTSTTTTINYIYTANQGDTTVSYVDDKGNTIQATTTDTTFHTGDVIALSNSTAPTLSGYTIQKTIVNGVDIGSAATGQPVMPPSDKATVQYVYTANPQKVIVKFVDAAGNPLPASVVQETNPTADSNSSIEIDGVTNAPIDYANPININPNVKGYTLQSDGRTLDENQRYDNEDGTDQIVKMIYLPNKQTAKVQYQWTVDGENFNLLSPTQDLTGVSGATVDYATISKQFQGYALISDGSTSNPTYDFEDTVDQQVNMVFSPYQQVAVAETDATDPGTETSLQPNQTPAYSAGSNVLAETSKGYSNRDLTFTTGADMDTAKTITDANYERAGYSYLVQGPDGSWYKTFSEAISNNSKYDTDGSSTPVISQLPASLRLSGVLNDGAIQTLVQGITPAGMEKEKKISLYSNVLGMMGSLIVAADAPSGALQPQNPQISPNGASGVDSKSQTFIATYSPQAEAAVVQTTNDPAGNKVYQASNGVSEGNITTLNVEDALDSSGTPAVGGNANPTITNNNSKTTGNPNLYRTGYTYQVKGPDGKMYDNLSEAIKANPTFDRDTNTNQIFEVVYTPQMQTAIIKTDSSDPRGANDNVETQQGPSDSNIAFNKNDTNLKREGYTYKVTGPDNKEYDTLEEALKNNPTYDNNALTNDVDDSPQVFTVHYTPVKQTVNVVVNGKTTETTTGDSDSNIKLNTTDNDLKRPGYTYKVTGPDGKKYDSLADALKANPKYDHNDLTDGKDDTPQNFTVGYTPVKQTVNVVVDGKTKESTTGDSDSSISLSTTDKDLKKEGYTYKVTGPDGKTYDTLADALKANPKYDHNDLTNGKDDTPQNFTVKYTPVKQTVNVVVNGKTTETTTGDSDSSIKLNTTDKDLSREGYTYKVTGPDGKKYDSLADALKANPTYDHNDLTNGKDDTPQNFTVEYTPVKQTVNVVAKGGPKNGKTIKTKTGDSESKISLGITDKDLKESGYTYKVKGPDGKTYNTIEDALRANPKYDHNDLTNGKDNRPQNFEVIYTPMKQDAYIEIVTDGNDYSTIETKTGDSDSKISFTTTDKDLKKDGYTYKVKGPDGKTYKTLAEALKANPKYDHNDLKNDLDNKPQVFQVIYTKDKGNGGPDTEGGSGTNGNNNSNHGSNNSSNSDLIDKLIDAQDGYDISDSNKKKIADEIVSQYDKGKQGTDFIEEILKKYAPNLTADELKKLANELWSILGSLDSPSISNQTSGSGSHSSGSSNGSSAPLPNNGEVAGTLGTIFGLGLIGGVGGFLWKKRKSENEEGNE